MPHTSGEAKFYFLNHLKTYNAFSSTRFANSTFPFRCECPQGFTGPLCQHNLNECESSPCVHGICVDQEDGFRCFCQPGFSGDLCNFEYNECDSNPCVNGLCIDHIGTYSCQCSKGYQGKQCHIKVILTMRLFQIILLL